MGRTLLLDVGGSNWRAQFTVNGHSQSARSRALPPIAGGELSPERLDAGLDEVWSSLQDPEATPEMVAMATAGMARLPGRIDLLHEGLHRWATVTDTLVVSDAAAGLAGALGSLEDGCLLSVGTGVAAVARSKDGDWTFKDGWGPLLGDEGGGYWIGAEGLRSALRHRDGRTGGSPSLAEMAATRYGVNTDTWPLRGDLEQAVQKIASFSTDVLEAAHQGETIADQIVDTACLRVIETAHALSEGREVNLAGGLAGAPVFKSRLLASGKAQGIPFVDADGDALSGLGLLGRFEVAAFATWLGDMGSWKVWR